MYRCSPHLSYGPKSFSCRIHNDNPSIGPLPPSPPKGGFSPFPTEIRVYGMCFANTLPPFFDHILWRLWHHCRRGLPFLPLSSPCVPAFPLLLGSLLALPLLSFLPLPFFVAFFLSAFFSLVFLKREACNCGVRQLHAVNITERFVGR